jgi:hypothetical protein
MPAYSADHFPALEGVAHTRFAVTLSSGEVLEVDGTVAIPIVAAINDGTRGVLFTDVEVNGKAQKILLVNAANVDAVQDLPR